MSSEALSPHLLSVLKILYKITCDYEKEEHLLYHLWCEGIHQLNNGASDSEKVLSCAPQRQYTITSRPNAPSTRDDPVATRSAVTRGEAMLVDTSNDSEEDVLGDISMSTHFSDDNPNSDEKNHYRIPDFSVFLHDLLDHRYFPVMIMENKSLYVEISLNNMFDDSDDTSNIASEAEAANTIMDRARSQAREQLKCLFGEFVHLNKICYMLAAGAWCRIYSVTRADVESGVDVFALSEVPIFLFNKEDTDLNERLRATWTQLRNTTNE